MRTMESHLKQCSFIEHCGISPEEKAHFSKVYGVNRKSILCKLPDFDITTQLPQDIKYLLFEGLFQMHVELFICYLVNEINVSVATTYICYS